MLILKCTDKAAQAFAVRRAALPQIPASENTSLLGDWFVNALRFGHTKALLFANADTLYSFLVPYLKKDLADPQRFFLENMLRYFLSEDLNPRDIERVMEEYHDMTLARSDSRSILGSMNDLANMYEATISAYGGIQRVDLLWVAWEINRTPQLKRGGKYSIDMLREKLAT